MAQWRLLLFGATGAIGGAVAREAERRDWHVTAVSRTDRLGEGWVDGEFRIYDPLNDDGTAFEGALPFDAVCWAHGANMADSVRDFDAAGHMELYRANCLSVIVSMSMLVERGLLRARGADGYGARLVVVSSIWQERARADKLSYTVSKAAVGGVVRSASVDLGADGHLVNAVLPGVLDTPMTRANLSAHQIETVAAKTTLGRLPDLATLAKLICFLGSEDNTSISGQSVAVDLGMIHANLI